ncbi:restriction endonuclease subunit S [Bacillus sonorensis]|uniref:Type I restriction-modification system,specificity subunit S n=1 Tax=Bacillus sonorensis L12 TaxID=1274524 RepID=M5P7X2_9BACI|nr:MULTISPECIES: restriction endonuclease subunit S [Bacillus]TWK74600.1 hypothetical protein CHCC20335_3014 [Bacillus paralicheniformis]EME75519.1 type I restriction-modification system,specificity subunit S [Bacillus sonorensis L12]MCY7858524.1 restriction endonuclease subunit S [Bacillus sonorensis]MCY8035764.1 restriction endonuclease subunit S [Bacillus sonorensis]MCY8272045.1 restriction endonuclease subunit S [Bacillus sonorensis]
MIQTIVPLLSICDFQGGTQPPKSEWTTEERDGYIRMLQIRDFTQERNVLEYVPLKQNLKTCEEDDILIARYGASIGKILTGLKGAYNVAIIKTIPDEHKILKKYLYYYLKSNVFQNFVKNVSTRAAQAGFNKQDLRKLNIYLPTLDIQKQIIDLLDKAQSLIHKRKAQIVALSDLTHSVFLEMFGDPIKNTRKWNLKSFEEIAKIDTKMVKNFDNYLGYKYIGIDNIEKNTGRLVNVKTVGEVKPTSSKYLFTDDHIIYSKIRPYLNKVAIPKFKGLCSADSYPILVDENVTTKEFLTYILRSQLFLNHVNSQSKRTNIPKVNKKQLMDFNTICPPLDLQKDFTNKVKNIELQIEKLNGSMKYIDNIFQSLMQRAFRGELFNN